MSKAPVGPMRAEAEAFLAAMREVRLPDGRECLVRHGHGPERLMGVTSRFAQNCTLSQEYKWIRGLRKRSFANDMALYHVVRVGSFHNPLVKQNREVSTDRMLVSVRF